MGPGTVGHVVINGHGKGVCLLEHHPHLLAQPGGVHGFVKNVLPVKADLPLNVHPGNQIVHSVQGFEEGGLSAAGRTNQGSDLPGRNVHIDIFQRVMPPVAGTGFSIGAVPQVQGLGGNDLSCHGSACLSFQFLACQGGGKVDQEHQQHQDRGNGKGHTGLPPLVGVDI